MSFNYRREIIKFDIEWQQKEKEMIDMGMPAEAINQMYEFDWKCFCKRGTYSNRNIPLNEEIICDPNNSADSSLDIIGQLEDLRLIRILKS